MHRIQYNLDLRDKWFSSRNLRVGVPPVQEQLPTVIVNKRALNPFGYNPSIIRHGGRLIMAYRSHPNGALQSRLNVAELSGDFKVLSNTPIDLAGGSIEDPRLFIHQDMLCMSYVISMTPNPPYTCVVRWGILHEDKPAWKVEGQWKPGYGDNDNTAMEKYNASR